MSNSNNKKRSFGDLESDEVEHFTLKKRKNEFSEQTWWMVDLDCATESNQGATALVKRCMRNYGWQLGKTKGVLTAYRQFLTLKKEQGDWDAKIFSPSHLVDQMWHQHILDIENYCHDMMMLCGGKIVLHNPDGALDQDAKKSRDETTRSELIKKFGSENVDREVWGFPTQPATKKNTPNTKPSDDQLKIVVKEPSNSKMIFHVSRKTPLGRVMGVYTNRSGPHIAQLQFFFHGKKIEKFDTPERLKMEDGDEIDMIPIPAEPITIIIKAGVTETSFKIMTDTRMGIVFARWAKHTGQNVVGFRFLFDGERIKDDETPAFHEMRDGDRIDAVLDQCGC